jgi:hypothetical protein
MHFERMLAGERPRVDRSRAGLGEARMKVAGDPCFAERRHPCQGRMDRKPAKEDPMRRTDDHDPARTWGALRPRAERGRGDRAGIDKARMWRDNDLWSNAPVWPGELLRLRDQFAKRRRLGRIEESRDLGGMDLIG